MQRRIKGTGSIKYNPSNNNYTMRKNVGRKRNGNRKIITVTARSEAECIRIMHEKELAWAAEKDNITVDYNVYMMCVDHLDQQIRNNELKPKSADRRRNTLNVIKGLKIANVSATDATPKQIKNAIDELITENRLGVSSIKKVLDVINAAYKYKQALGELEYNPVESVKKEISKTLSKMSTKEAYDADVEILSQDEQKRLVKECTARKNNNTNSNSSLEQNNSKSNESFNSTDYKHLISGWYILFLLYTGMRVGEFISLKWSDYDAKNSLLTINKNTSTIRVEQNGKVSYVPHTDSTKNSKARIIRLNKDAIETINMIYKLSPFTSEDDYICATRSGNQNTATNIEARAKRIYSNIGLNYGGKLHVLRKTFASNMYSGGARTKAIAAYIGDEDATVMKYYIAARSSVEVDGKMKNVVEYPS